MHVTSFKNIIVENRQRKEFLHDDIVTLRESIADKGLMHPIVCRETPDGIKLVAGERRLRAVRLLASADRSFICNGEVISPGNVPYLLLNDLTDYQIREAELEENLVRVDLTWQERTAAIAALHAFRKETNPAQTYRDTGKEVSPDKPSANQEVSRAVVISDYLDDPEVAKARDERTAFNIIAQRMQVQFQRELAELESEGDGHILLHGNALQKMRELPEKTFDCIIADPPYGMGAENFGDAAQVSHTYEDSEAIALEVSEAILSEGYRLCKDEAHLFMFCDIDLFHRLREFARDYGWAPLRTPLIWEKGGMGHLVSGPLGFRRSYEILLYASKGKRPLNTLSSDSIRIAATVNKRHAAEKPGDLYSHLLKISCDPGNSVLDPCCGCGTVFPAANAMKMWATGIELDEHFYQVSRGRIMELFEDE